MGRYLDIARQLSEGQATHHDGQTMLPSGGSEISEESAKSLEHRRLLAGGWVAKARCGKIIWASPQTGFWYSEEMALQLLRLDQGVSNEDEEEV
jgi:hypothetical protein